MKVSVSLPGDDVEFLDAYAVKLGLPSRSAVVHKSIRLLRAAELGASYDAAWAEWTADDEATPWDQTATDGLDPDAAR